MPLAELKRAQWEQALADLMKKTGRTPEEAAGARKGIPWKIALAAAMRRTTTASNRWLAEELHMGSGNAVGEYLSRVRAKKLVIQEIEP